MKTAVSNGKAVCSCLMIKMIFISLICLSLFVFYPAVATVAAADSQQTLRIMFLPNKPQIQIIKTFAPFIKALGNELKMKVQVFSGKDYNSIIDKLRSRQTDIGMLGGFAYVSAHDDFGVKIFVRNLEADASNGGVKESYHSLIVTRKDSNIRSIKDLKGKRFAFTDRKSTSGFLFPLCALMSNKIDLKDLGQIVYVNKHVNSLMAVYNNQVDAGALSDGSYFGITNVHRNQINILWESDPIHYGAWVARNDMPDEQLALIRSAFLKISRRKDAVKIFGDAYIKGFVPANDADYENVRQVVKTRELLEKR